MDTLTHIQSFWNRDNWFIGLSNRIVDGWFVSYTFDLWMASHTAAVTSRVVALPPQTPAHYENSRSVLAAQKSKEKCCNVDSKRACNDPSDSLQNGPPGIVTVPLHKSYDAEDYWGPTNTRHSMIDNLQPRHGEQDSSKLFVVKTVLAE